LTRMSWKFGVLIGLLLLHLIISFLLTVPGYLSIDEAVYHLMSRDFAATLTFEISNGYREFPSEECSTRFFFPVKGRLVSQYPHLFTLLVAPLYHVCGFKGLFMVNALSFIGVVLLCYLLTSKIFSDRELSLNACLVLCGATFVWEYSQAAWPHMTALLGMMAAYYLAVSALLEPNRQRQIANFFFAGLLTGISAGIRTDAILLVACFYILYVVSSNVSGYAFLSLIVGLLPGMVVLGAINQAKFGSFSPLSYGSGEKFPMIEAGVALLLASLVSGSKFLFRRLSDNRRYKRRAVIMIFFLSGLVMSALIVTRPGARIIRDSYSAVVDIRAVPPDFQGPAHLRTVSGGLVYIGAHKKALLQSLPYLAVVLLPFCSMRRTRGAHSLLLLLVPVPIIYIGYYAVINHEYGGLCLNYRYHLPLLPFTSIMVAYSLRELRRLMTTPLGRGPYLVTVIVTVAFYLLLTEFCCPGLSGLEFPLLDLPLVLFVSVVLLVLVRCGLGLVRAEFWLKAIALTVTAALSWSSLVAFTYDYRVHQAQRKANYLNGGRLLDLLPDRAVFFTEHHIDPFLRLIEDDSVLICFPYRDRFRDFPALLAFHLAAGRPAYAFFRTVTWESFQSGLLKDYQLREMWPYLDGYVAEISKKRVIEEKS